MRGGPCRRRRNSKVVGPNSVLSLAFAVEFRDGPGAAGCSKARVGGSAPSGKKGREWLFGRRPELEV